MSSPSLLHRVAAQYLHDRNKRKQSDSILIQPGHTIWVSRHRTLRTQYLHIGVFLSNQFMIPAKTFAICKVFIYKRLYYFTFHAPSY